MDGRALLSGMAIGAVVTLAFDSSEGTRRRAALRARLSRATRTAGVLAGEAVRDVGHRAAAVVTAASDRFFSAGHASTGCLADDEVDDRRVLRRVRARLGRLCAHPDAVEVSVSDGVVTLHGPVLVDEVRTLLTAAASVRGVHAIVNDLEAYDIPEDLALHLQAERLSVSSIHDVDRVRTAGRALAGVAALAAGGLAFAYSRK